MKKVILILIVSLVSFGLGYWTGIIKKSVDEKFEFISEAVEASDNSNNENFDDFIYKFTTDSLFQLERII
jgi:hypothetical protein